MKILMVSSYLPYPLFNGGNIRLYNLIRHLSKKHEITLICEKRTHQTEADLDELRKFCKDVITFPRKKQWSFKNILRSAYSSDPFLVIGHTIPEMRTRIGQELIEKNFDLIHVETFYVLQNVPSTTLPIILAEHNIEYMVYERFAMEAPFWLRPLLDIDVSKLRRKETQAWKNVSRLISVSAKEKDIMQSAVKTKIDIVPNGVDLGLYKFQDSKSKFQEKEKRILFVGDFKWVENRNSAEWILKQIWPKIKAKLNAKLWIVGRNIPNYIRDMGDKDVIFSPNLSKASEIYKNSYILLSPIKVGGGTSFKILESMASGVPIVTTKLGAEGIGDVFPTAENPQELAEKVGELFFNLKLYEELAIKARKLVEEKYDWKKIASKLDKVYSSALE